MSHLILIRHGQSVWNLENKFTGWVDVELSEKGKLEASKAGELIKELNIDRNKVNVNGGAIALGHPIGASGARILVTLTHELIKQKKNKGCATLCIGGGMGIAMCIEKI